MINLKNARLAANRTQQEVADFLGVARVTYARYEGGVHEPDLATVVRLAKLFGVSTDYLLGVTDTPYYTAESPASDGKPIKAYSTANKAPLSPVEVEAIERIERDPEAAGVVKVPLSELLKQEGLPESLRRILEDIAKEAVKKALEEELDRRGRDNKEDK